jgi:hypothetical protein
MADLTKEDIIALAVGMNISSAKVSPREWAKLSQNKTVKEYARKIVLREMIRLIEGGDVEKGMRPLIAVWCYQQLMGKRSGRPKNQTKERLIYVAFQFMASRAENQNPKPQRKAIVGLVAEYFDVKPRRVYEALKRQEPGKINGRGLEAPLSKAETLQQMDVVRKALGQARR